MNKISPERLRELIDASKASIMLPIDGSKNATVSDIYYALQELQTLRTNVEYPYEEIAELQEQNKALIEENKELKKELDRMANDWSSM